MTKTQYLLPITRDSVAAEDDVFAPHSSTLVISTPTNYMDICVAITEMNYLANIVDNKATWLIRFNTKPIDVIAQELEYPKTPAANVEPDQNSNVHCEYLQQQDPNAVYNRYFARPSGSL